MASCNSYVTRVYTLFSLLSSPFLTFFYKLQASMIDVEKAYRELIAVELEVKKEEAECGEQETKDRN